jgi:hypothetical protein
VWHFVPTANNRGHLLLSLAGLGFRFVGVPTAETVGYYLSSLTGLVQTWRHPRPGTPLQTDRYRLLRRCRLILLRHKPLTVVSDIDRLQERYPLIAVTGITPDLKVSRLLLV